LAGALISSRKRYRLHGKLRPVIQPLW
jgi:hypothetical protein